MPTGYTARIKDGIDFPTFAMDCARAFGACIDLRDEAGGGEKIPAAFVVDRFYTDALQQGSRDLAEWKALSADQRKRRYDAALAERQERNAQYARKFEHLRRSYESMLAQIDAWQPPTADHAELKKFMRQQVEESLRWDCGALYQEPEMPSFLAWEAQETDRLRERIERDRVRLEEETKRAAERTEWIRALRASLAGDGGAA